MIAPYPSIHDSNVLPAVRVLFSQHPSYRDSSAHEIASVLRAHGYVNHRPHEVAVEAALEVLTVEGEVLA